MQTNLHIIFSFLCIAIKCIENLQLNILVYGKCAKIFVSLLADQTESMYLLWIINKQTIASGSNNFANGT